MASRTTKVIVVMPTFQSAILIAMGDYIKKLFRQGEVLLQSVTGETDAQKEYLKRILAQEKPSALISMDIRPDSETVTAYTTADVPIVLIDEEMGGVSTIATDNYLGGHIAGEYLISKGKKKIGIVTGRTKIKGGYNAEQRLKGFQQALNAKGLFIPRGCIMEVVNYSREDGIEVMPKLIDAGPDAIFCAAGDNCAMGLITVAKERRIRIPENIAIVGFDDLRIAQLSSPALTTIRQPLQEMAKAAYELAVNQRNEIIRKPQIIKFSPELVIRQSA
jgi:DNA-binding LacI/PurR family transcriptional regulator